MPLPSEGRAFDLNIQISTQMPPVQRCVVLTIPAEREPLARYLALQMPDILHHTNLYLKTRTHGYLKLARAIRSLVPVFHVRSLTAWKAPLSLFCCTSGQADMKAFSVGERFKPQKPPLVWDPSCHPYPEPPENLQTSFISGLSQAISPVWEACSGLPQSLLPE